MEIKPVNLANIALVIFDVDGVLTDGRLIMDDHGVESKFFSVRDGYGLRLMMRAGIELAILTARRSGVVEKRAQDLGIENVWQGIDNKLEAYETMREQLSLSDDQVAYAGDDLIDLPVMRRVGLAMAPIDAAEEVKAVCHFVSSRPGGHGAARDMVEYILKGAGLWEKVTGLGQ